MTNNETNEKKAYIEMYDALRDLNGALTSLLRLNWTQYPWSKVAYYRLSREYEVLREKIKNQSDFDKTQAIIEKQDDEVYANEEGGEK